MALYRCEFEGSRSIKRIRVAHSKNELQLGLMLDGITKYKVEELADLHGFEYVLFGDTSDIVLFGTVQKAKKVVVSDFFEQLSFLLGSGMPLYNSIESLGKSGGKEIKRICLKLIPYIIEGIPFDEALNRTRMFEPEVVQQIRAGVESGNLSDALVRISNTLKKQIDLKKKAVSAAVYPSFMLAMTIAVLIFMLVYIIPKLSKTFKDLGSELPKLTQFVVDLSDAFMDNLAVGSLVLAAIIISIVLVLDRVPKVRLLWDQYLLKVPLFGDLGMKRAIASISLVMSSLLTCGVPVVQALSITADTVKNTYIKKQLQEVKRLVESDGHSLYTAIVQVGCFPQLFMQIIDVGERSGETIQALDRLAIRYDQYVEEVMKRIMSLMEPAIILILVCVGGVVVLAMMLPIFNVIELV